MQTQNENPLLSGSTVKFGAFPFNLLKKSHFVPAIEEAIKIAKQNVETIKNNSAPPTFENTILELEVSSEKASRVSTVFFNLLSAESDEELQAMAKDISPKLADFSSDVTLDLELFKRIKVVYENRKTLSGEELRLTEKSYRDFARNGALLDDAKKDRLRAIDQELSQLGPDYSDRILNATNEFEYCVTDRAELSGLPESSVEAAAELAEKSSKYQGKKAWLFNLQAPSYIPLLTYADNRALREKMWRAYNTKATSGKNDNHELCVKITALKYERSRLLGFENYAAFTLEERMAQTPDQVQKFLERLTDKSLPAARRDLKEVQEFRKTLEPAADELMPWDYGYYSEKLKISKYAFDEEELRPYFRLDNVVEGVFEHARRLYGIKFQERNDIPAYHPDVKVYEVVQEGSGDFVGLFYADFFPRKGKRGGAWMTIYREQGLQEGKVERPHVSIVCNFAPPVGDKPSLLNMMEVRTLFHEFGHSLHGLLSNCKYVSLSGANVYWDFVELPSQIMENWVYEKEALDLFAKHYETGEKISAELMEKIRKSTKFQAGYSSLRQIQFATLDMAWFTTDPKEIKDVDTFERHAIRKHTLLPDVPGISRSCSFSHIFSGGYAAGYYSYKWAEVLDADAFELFKEKGLFNREVADSFRKNILSRGGTEHPMELYKRFRGREPDPDALLRRDGLI